MQAKNKFNTILPLDINKVINIYIDVLNERLKANSQAEFKERETDYIKEITENNK